MLFLTDIVVQKEQTEKDNKVEEESRLLTSQQKSTHYVMHLKEQLKGGFESVAQSKNRARYCTLISKNISCSSLAAHKVLVT